MIQAKYGPKLRYSVSSDSPPYPILFPRVRPSMVTSSSAIATNQVNWGVKMPRNLLPGSNRSGTAPAVDIRPLTRCPVEQFFTVHLGICLSSADEATLSARRSRSNSDVALPSYFGQHEPVGSSHWRRRYPFPSQRLRPFAWA